jgi:hypothetical protein
MKNKKGVTYIEMLVGIIVSSFVVILMAAVLSLCRTSYARTVNETELFSDAAFGLKLLQSRVHRAKSLIEQAAGGQWMSEQLVIDNTEAFGLYKPTGSTITEFVYMADRAQPNNREVIFTVSANDTASFSVTISGAAATVQLNGKKQKAPFDLSTIVMRRS